MNNNEIDFLRSLSNTVDSISLDDALLLLDRAKWFFPAKVEHQAKRIFPADDEDQTTEGTTWRGILFTPAAEDAMRCNRKIEAIKHVRDANRGGWSSGYRYNSSDITGKLALKDAKDIVEARMAYLGL